jgi:hypothetical protein
MQAGKVVRVADLVNLIFVYVVGNSLDSEQITYLPFG